MRVPAAHVDRDEGDPRLDEPPGQERALSPAIAAIAIADARILAVDVEGSASAVAGDDIERLAVEAVIALGRALRIDVAAQVVGAAEQFAAIAEAAEVHLRRQAQIAD